MRHLIEVDAKMIESPMMGIEPAPMVKEVGIRLYEHNKGHCAGGYLPLGDKDPWEGCKKDLDPHVGEIILWRPVKKKFDKGFLLFSDACRIVEKYLSMGLNPLAHAQVWYQSGQCQDQPHWKIINGWSQLRRPHKAEFFPMTDDERKRNGLEPDDIGIIAYGIDNNDLFASLVIRMLDRTKTVEDARREAAKIASIGHGVGVYTADEQKSFRVKGRSPEWRCKRRAARDLAGEAVGDPTPAELKHYATGQGIGAGPADLELLAQPTGGRLGSGDQERALATARNTRQIQAGAPPRLPETDLRNNPMREDDIDLETGDVIPEREFRLIPSKPKQSDWWKNEADFNTFMIELPGDAYLNFLEAKGLNGKADLAILGTLDEARQSARAWMNKPF